jgi:hypothetical protein
MGIINRDLNKQQQKSNVQDNFATMNLAGSTYVVGFLPNNGLVTGVFAAAVGISNTPLVTFSLYRFCNGSTLTPFNGTTQAGFTAIPISATLSVAAFGTSGWVYYGATINGLTIANVLGVTAYQGDMLVAQMAGTNAALTTAIVGGVVQATDDILQWPG